MTDVKLYVTEASVLLGALTVGFVVAAGSTAATGGQSFADGLVAGVFGTIVAASIVIAAGRRSR